MCRADLWASAGMSSLLADQSPCDLLSFDGYIKIFDPLPSPPTLLRTFHAVHMSPADALVAASSEADALYHTINQIILENDLVVASIGRKVFAWRAGTGKGRQDGKGGEKRRVSGAKGEFKGNGRTLGTSRAQELDSGTDESRHEDPEPGRSRLAP